ncbi:MAG TPA: hypothetical protein VIC05_13490 [Solirubrobacteraceae bacterium]
MIAEDGEAGRREPGSGRSAEHGSLEPRRRILEALIQTAARESYDGTCVERVLSAAKLPAAVFQEYFQDIQDCFLQASDELVGQLELTLLRSTYVQASWPERIQRGLQTLLRVVAEHPHHARVVAVECPRAGQRASDRLRAAEAVFVPLFEEGRTYAASVDHLPQEISQAMVGGIASIVHTRIVDGRVAELPSLLPDLLAFALMPYAGTAVA